MEYSRSVGITKVLTFVSCIFDILHAKYFAHVQTGPGAHPASCTMGTGSFPGVKQPGRGADHPPPSSAEVKKEYSYTSTPPLGLRVCYGVPLPLHAK
jgi:hypothetical protein